MNRKTLVIAAVVIAVLLPMWYVALHGEPPSEEIAIDQSVSEIQPLDGVLDTPNKLSPSQVGVIVWVALFGLFGTLAAVHRFMNRAVRPPDPDATTDGGRTGWSWIDTDHRWVVEYHDATESVEGLAAMGGLTVLAIVFAALFTGEYLTLARTQYFGLYATGMFLSLALLTVAYYAWFLPHVEVAEQRGHEP
ncbi:hypothetical protein [Halapricum hydrolyticum]|uniref:Uncharacterized protein n=1 Tax=Halapricum hydrolyticum TaxID=2979991 RepID=A0AAE3IBI5_9EURY|nr:hypothetical protein [Halapricum hydrolyticum]MCU4716960.1 hypothetical protein [Halapricum hydrolyticum]MCU4725435.1 hypothetical protein [Halapricum hydrolyticum]